MQLLESDSIPTITTLLQAGQIGVLRTDTLYGIVCQAGNQQAVERIYQVKGRDDTKSPIVLIADQQQVFDAPSESIQQVLGEVWPGKVSVIIPTTAAPAWVERGNHSVAYRLPDNAWLQCIVTQTGPLIAPSANPQGQPPAMDIQQAIDYFGQQVDFYVDGGTVTDATPSRLLRVTDDGSVETLR